jgi:ribonuclease BN (tRNA processing enzyme)
MKLQFLGTGTFGAKTRALTSFLIDDELLFDIGHGTVRQLMKYGCDLKRIKQIVITHYHTDHFFDIADFLYRRKIQGFDDQPLVIVGPKDIKTVVIDLCKTYMKFGTPPMNNVEFRGVEDETLADGLITAYSVEHDPYMACSGYVIQCGDVKLGFNGDGTKCPGLDKIIEGSLVCFVDTTRDSESDASHLNLGGALAYAKQFSDKQFYLIHRGDYDLPTDLPSNVHFPDDGDVIEL